MDDSNENIINNFFSNGILNITGEQDFFLGEDYRGVGTTGPKNIERISNER